MELPKSNRDTVNYQTRKSPVSIRAALARANRRLFEKGYGPQIHTARSHGDKQIGQWLLIGNNIVKDGFNHERLEEYLREIGALAGHESLGA